MKSGEQQSESKAHSKPHGCAKRGGRPVTWIGGGGLDPKKLAGLGVPSLRELFAQVFGENTASNNAGWLRRKLAECPDNVHGQRRSLVVRARDMGAAIWNSPVITPGEPGQIPEEHAAETAGTGDADGFDGVCDEAGATQSCKAMEVTEASCKAQLGQASADASVTVLQGNSSHHHRHHRGVKRSCTEASATLAQKASALRCHSPSGSGSGMAAGTHLDGSVSPRAHHKPHHHHHNQGANSGTSKQCSPGAGSADSGVGMVIKPESFTDSYCGLKVMVYWPADKKWWEATICGLSTAVQHLQLLYSDLTEESIIGQDFTELLRKGHLALAYGQEPPASTGMASGGPAAAVQDSVACGSASGFAPGAPAANLGLPSMTYGRRVQSCLLPSSACTGSRASYQDFNRSASMNFCARVSTTGSGNGSGSASGGDLELAQAAKRQCYEESNNSGSNGSNPADITATPCGVARNGFATAAEQQQRQGSDATQLELWFASQQRQQQQLQLQLQMQANLQMQQQVQLQMQRQMAVHMSMQQAAGQYMHLQAPALSAPVAPAAAANMPSTATAYVRVPDLQSPFAGVASSIHSSAGSPAAAAPAAMAAPTAVGCLQNAASASNGAWGVWQPACAPAYGTSGPCSPAGLQQQQTADSAGGCNLGSGGYAGPATVQQQWSLPPVQLPQCCRLPGSSSTTSPRACDHVVPELNAKLASASIGNVNAAHPQQLEPALQQQGAGGATNMVVHSIEGGYISIKLEADQLASCRTGSGLQALAGNSGDDRAATAAAAAGDVIASLLSKAGENLFELDQLEQDAGAVQQRLAGAATSLDVDLDGCDDGMCCDRCSSGGNSSLCESVADELAVAGLDADDAPGYYMFGGAGSPRQQPVQQAGSFGEEAAAAYAWQCSEVEAELSLDACCGGVRSGTGGFADDAGFKVASEPCENSFAHMFDFD